MSAKTEFYVTPILEQQYISNIMVKRGSNKVGEVTEIDFYFILMQNFQDTVSFTINLPTNFAFNATKCYYIKDKKYKYEYVCQYNLADDQSIIKVLIIIRIQVIFKNMCDGVFYKCQINTEINLVI